MGSERGVLRLGQKEKETGILGLLFLYWGNKVREGVERGNK